MPVAFAQHPDFVARFRGRLVGLRERLPCRVERELVPAHFREASVLLPFWPDGDTVRVLMTLRQPTLSAHAGQISFPGGRRDATDLDLRHTALRETHEEVGIAPDQVGLVMPFDDAWSIQGYLVSSWVGWLDTAPVVLPNPAEIERVIVADVRELMDPNLHRVEHVTRLGVTYPIHFFDYRGDVVWGMTAGILHALLLWVQGLPIPPEQDGRGMLLRYLGQEGGVVR